MLPKQGETVSQSFYGYWSLTHGFLYVTETNYCDTDSSYVRLFGPTLVDFKVTENPARKLAEQFDAARTEAERTFHTQIQKLDEMQSKYLALEMSDAKTD